MVGGAARRMNTMALSALVKLGRASKDLEIVQACVQALTEAAVHGDVGVIFAAKVASPWTLEP